MKCDMQQPQCARCLRSGLECSGPKSSGALFVNRHADTFLSQTAQMALVEAYQDRPREARAVNDTGTLHQATLLSIQQFRYAIASHQTASTLSRAETTLISHTAETAPLYLAILDEFKPENAVGIFGGDRAGDPRISHYSNIATVIRGLLPLTSKGFSVLDRSVFSLFTLYYGRLHSDSGLVALARSSYTSALSHFSQRLGKLMANNTPEHQSSFLAFTCAAVALQLFEHLNEVDVTGEAQLAHIDGALRLLRICEPTPFQMSRDLRNVYSGLRGSAVFLAIDRREPTFLAETAWLDTPYRGQEKSAKERLVDLGLEIPALLCNADKLIQASQDSPNSTASSVNACFELLLKFTDLRRRLEEWLYDLTLATPGPLYWTKGTPVVRTIIHVDFECQPRTSNPIRDLCFPCGSVAGLLIHYWTFQLQLSMSAIDIQRAMLMNIAVDTVSDSQLAATTNRHLETDYVAAEEYAKLVLEGQPFVGSCFEGLLCLQSPLRIVGKYYDRPDIGLREKEKREQTSSRSSTTITSATEAWETSRP